MWILALILRLINTDKMAENTEEALLSLGHLLEHLPILITLVQGYLDRGYHLSTLSPLALVRIAGLLVLGIFTPGSIGLTEN